MGLAAGGAGPFGLAALPVVRAGEGRDVLGRLPLAAVRRQLHRQRLGKEGIQREGDLDLLDSALRQRKEAVGRGGAGVGVQAAQGASL